jgi:hypothetical protein
VTAQAKPTRIGDRFIAWLDTPVHVLRLEVIRIAAPLAILAFMSSRISYAEEWIGDAGFRVPDLGVVDYRQPLYLPSLPSWAAWALCIALIASGLSLAAGFKPRRAALIFAACAAFVALSDRLAAFSVSKLAPVVALALAASPCGARWSVDAWLAKKKNAKLVLPKEMASGSIRFFQVLLPVIYSASGISKARGDWVSHSYVLWTHLHDTYQTAFTVFLANLLPAGAWTLLQYVTLTFEAGAPLWFGIKRTRTIGLIVGVGMHTMIGLMFGPVRWFALLMITLLVGSFLPDRFLDRALETTKRWKI